MTRKHLSNVSNVKGKAYTWAQIKLHLEDNEIEFHV